MPPASPQRRLGLGRQVRLAFSRTAPHQGLHAGALVLQQAFAHAPAAVEFADQILLAGDGVVEKGLVEGRLPGDQADGLHPHPRLVHRQQQEADALMLWRIRVGAHQNEHPIRKLGAGGPGLLAVDDEVVAPILRPSAQAGQIAAGAGFAVALAPFHCRSGDARQVGLLLQVGAELKQGGAEHAGAEAGQRRAGVNAAHFLQQDQVLLLAEGRAAVLLRPVRHGPALLDHQVQPRQGVPVPDLDLGAAVGYGAGAAGAGGAVRRQPGSRLRPEILKPLRLHPLFPQFQLCLERAYLHDCTANRKPPPPQSAAGSSRLRGGAPAKCRTGSSQ